MERFSDNPETKFKREAEERLKKSQPSPELLASLKDVVIDEKVLEEIDTPIFSNK